MTVSRAVLWLSWGWAVVTAILWFLLTRYSETSLLLTMLLYGPRIVVLGPIIVLGALALFASRRALLPLLLAALMSVIGIMGFRFSPVTLVSSGLGIPQTPTSDVRIVSLNSQGGDVVQGHINQMISRYDPSVISFQECGRELATALERLPEWHFNKHQSLCIISKWPISARDTMPRGAFARVARLGYGGSALVVAYDIEHPLQPFTLVSMHLETPRKGLARILGSGGVINDETGLPDINIRDNTQRFALNSEIRERESARASDWILFHAQRRPVIVTGDFNMPVESSIYHSYWSDFVNAFDKRGMGFGFTKHEGRLLRIRIDHVLLTPNRFKVHGAWVGENVGSDHRPMIADIELVRH